MVHEIVGRINGQFGTLTYVPIYHLDTSLSFTELCALYAVTDVAMVSSSSSTTTTSALYAVTDVAMVSSNGRQQAAAGAAESSTLGWQQQGQRSHQP